ncbi:hypothetical protein Tsubulata_009595 [Turnera subulata]|uniref:SCA7 domain-containing protein n=1 Tax=Turnera subulata TaxID=218843 RepID=A0A9Q0F1D0_9ROSI|nr:hypothetical protein Tsubulata_009595 [Turnera subulata]
MVCSLGDGRMAVMARLLASGGLSESAAEDVSQQKFTAQSINRELRDADEANLLDEEDMHVFGLMPMADPLLLVCCNACKKPVKASQYAAHSDQATPIVEHRRSESADVDDTAASESQFYGQRGTPPLPMDTKGNSASIDVASMMDGKGLSRENKDHSACVMSRPTKRSKLKSSQQQRLSDDPETASGLTKITNSLDQFTSRDCQVQSFSQSDMPNKSLSKHSQEAHEQCLLTKDIPVPLATKIYYSQRNNRFRSAVAHMYHVASVNGICPNMVTPEQSWETTMAMKASYQGGSSYGQKGHSTCKPDQIVLQGSESCSEKSKGSPPINNFSSQNPVDNIPRPQTAAAGLLRSKYITKPHSFASNSGQALETMQQANGSVHVL